MKLLYRNNIAGFSEPVCTASGSKITVTGQIEWFKEGTWGYAYKKSSATSWTYKPTDSKDINATISNATSGAKYQVKFFVKYEDEYQYSSAVSVTV